MNTSFDMSAARPSSYINVQAAKDGTAARWMEPVQSKGDTP